MELAAGGNWWWPHKEFCICTERPKAIHRRDGRLHCDDGMAMEFRDGWGLWCIDGVLLPEKLGPIIVRCPDKLTLQCIEKETNEEVRRVMIERFGWLRYLRESRATVIDRRTNDIDATREVLCETRVSRGSRRILVCHCPSTGRVYAMGVDQRISTCAQAQEWMNGGGRFAPKRVILTS